MDKEKQLRRMERRSRESKKERRKSKKERRSRKSKKERSKKPSKRLSKKPSSRFGKGDEKERKERKEEIALLAQSRGMTTAHYMYQRELDSRNHLLTHTPPTKLERALALSRNSGQTYSSNPERPTYTVSRTEFENSIQEMKDSMRRLQTYTIRDLENKINILRKEAMLKSIYSYVIVQSDNRIVSWGGSELILSPIYFYLTDKIMLGGSNNINILQKFPNVRSVYFNGDITSPIDFRGLERIESLTSSIITVPIDLTPLINLKYISFNGGSYSNSLDNIREGLKNLNKLKVVSAPTPLTQTQLTEYGIRYDNSRQSERDDILKDYIYDDEDYEDEFTRISVGRRDRRDGAGLPS